VANNKKIPVIIFDEAHLLKHENFYELQIISNFSMDSTDPALFILSGQPHLRDKLLNLMHQAFNQRITEVQIQRHHPSLWAYTRQKSLISLKKMVLMAYSYASILRLQAGI